jgi:MSHA biogenesis protein MshP
MRRAGFPRQRPARAAGFAGKRAGTCAGFAIVTALFLIVVLAAMGAFMMNLSAMQHGTSTLSLTSSRVYYAARSGLEWGTQQTVIPAAGAACPVSPTTFSPAGPGFIGITVSVTCAYFPFTAGFGDEYHVYRLTSTASFGTLGSADYVERKLTSMVCRSNNPSAEHC